MQTKLISDDESKFSDSESTVFKFDTIYREVGLRIRVDELTFINTAEQKYGINMVVDRTWEASLQDIKQWKRLRATMDENGKNSLGEYQPDYIPFICFVNLVTVIWEDPCLWEKTNGKYIIQKKNGKFYNRYKLRGQYEYTEEFEVVNYPFDLQNLSIVFAAESSDLSEQRLVPHHICKEYFSLNLTWSSITDWNIVSLVCSEHLIDSDNYFLNKAPEKTHFLESWVNYKIQVKRRWKGILYRVALWMLLLGMLSFCIFSHSHLDTGDRLSFGITMVLTIVAFQFVITSSLPQVNYLTMIDKYNLFIFGINGLFMLETAFLSVNGIFDEDTGGIVDDFCFYCFVILFVIGHVYFIVLAWRENKKEWAKLDVPYEKVQEWIAKQETTNNDLGVKWISQFNTLDQFKATIPDDLKNEYEKVAYAS